jgi:hypothetical protein
MRLNALYLTGALTVLAMPLSAGAQPAQSTGPRQPNSQATTDVQQMIPGEDTCGPGWRWRKQGKPSTVNGVPRTAHLSKWTIERLAPLLQLNGSGKADRVWHGGRNGKVLSCRGTDR